MGVSLVQGEKMEIFEEISDWKNQLDSMFTPVIGPETQHQTQQGEQHQS